MKTAWLKNLLGVSALFFTASAIAAPTVTMWASGEKDYFHPGTNYINHFFRRAPGFFDVVCDTGTGSAHAITLCVFLKSKRPRTTACCVIKRFCPLRRLAFKGK